MPRKQKVFVLGSGRRAGVDSGDWFGHLPNLADYDAVVVSTASLHKDLAEKSGELEERAKTNEKEAEKERDKIARRLGEIRSKLARVLATRGTVVAIVHPLDVWYSSRFRTDAWQPLDIRTIKEPGDTLEGERDPVENYLTKVKRWSHVLKVPDDLGALGDELTFPNAEVRSLGLGHDRQGHPVALAVWAEASATLRTPSAGSGPFYCLVPPTECSDYEAVSILLADMFGIEVSTPAPEWTRSIEAPGEGEVRERLEQAQANLASARDASARAKEEHDEVRAPVRILYEQHAALQSAVEDAFRRMGIGTKPSPVSDEFVLELDGRELLIEVKGHARSVTQRDVSQLFKDLATYFAQEGTAIKGVLVANVWVNDPPEERLAPEKAPFPDNVIRFCASQHVALLCTRELFEAYRMVKACDLSAFDVFERLATTDGVVNFKQES